MSLARITGVFAALMLSVVPAYADGSITPFLGYNFGGDSGNCVSLTDCQEKHMNFGLAVRSSGRVLGLEEELSYARDFFGTGSDNSVLTVMTNLMMTIPIGPIQPYVAGGIGLIRSHATYNPLQIATSKSAFGRDFGGGLTIMFGRAGLRGDLRHFHASDSVTFLVFNPEKLDFWRASAGITFKY